MVGLDTGRGGILISTWRPDNQPGSLLSNLTLNLATQGDKGNYSCSLPGPAAALGRDTGTQQQYPVSDSQ